MATTFDKYGGFSTVSRVVMTFYDKVLDNDTVGPYFDDIDMPRQIDHQTKFVASIMGGPAAMGDDRLESVHKRLNISDDEFNEVVTLLKEAMVEHGMDAQDIADVAQVFEQKRGIIVGSGQ